MEKPAQGYMLRVDLALSGPGFIGGEMRFSIHRETGLQTIREVAELLIQIDTIVKMADTKPKG